MIDEKKLCERINIPFETYQSWKNTNPELVKLINYGLKHEEEIINYLKMQLRNIDSSSMIVEIEEEYFGKKMTEEEKETLKKNDNVFRDKVLEELKSHNVDA